MKMKVHAQIRKAIQSKTKATTGLLRYKRVSCFIGYDLKILIATVSKSKLAFSFLIRKQIEKNHFKRLVIRSEVAKEITCCCSKYVV